MILMFYVFIDLDFLKKRRKKPTELYSRARAEHDRILQSLRMRIVNAQSTEYTVLLEDESGLE